MASRVTPVRRLLRRFGIDLVRSRPLSADFLARLGVDTVLDVGANVGQYAGGLRAWGYRGRIVSFEPLGTAFAELSRRAAGDPRWDVVNTAVGAENGTAEIQVSELTVYSSIRRTLPALDTLDPRAAAVRSETVSVRTIDALLAERGIGGDRLFLKADTQGYEREVLRGAAGSLDRVRGLQLELSLVPLYDGETLFREMLDLVDRAGFVLGAAEPVVFDERTQALLQLDCIFVRRPA